MSYLKVPNTGWDSVIDTGFGNRIQLWEIAYELNKFNDFKFTILVDENKWRETKFLNFPYTESSNIRFSDLKDFSEIDTKYPNWLKKLDTNENWDIIDKWPNIEELTPSFLTKRIRFIRDFYGKWMYLVTLKDKVLENKIKEVVKDRIGIHIRHWPIEDIDLNQSTVERFNYDEKMKLVREIMDKYPNSKFYISTDVTYDKPATGTLLPDFRKKSQWISEIYRDYDVIDYRDIISPVEVDKIYDRKTQRDVVDLFSLIYSKEFISSRKTGMHSSWSEFVKIYRKKS